MTVPEALAFLDLCSHWRISRLACSLTFDFSGDIATTVTACVRRKRGESLSAMIVRCAELGSERLLTNWKNPLVLPRTATCAACGRDNAWRDLRVDRALKLPLCSECRRGVRSAVRGGPS